MKFIAKIASADGPIKFSPISITKNGAQGDHVVAIAQADAKKFIKDIAALFQSKIVDIQDRLIGATFTSDRVLYFGKRSEWVEMLECRRTVPYVIELIRDGEQVWLNKLPASQIKSMGGKTIFGLAFGDTEVEYLFPVVAEN